MSSEEGVNIIISYDPLIAPSVCQGGVDCSCEDFQISTLYLLAKNLWRALICSSGKIVPCKREVISLISHAFQLTVNDAELSILEDEDHCLILLRSTNRANMFPKVAFIALFSLPNLLKTSSHISLVSIPWL